MMIRHSLIKLGGRVGTTCSKRHHSSGPLGPDNIIRGAQTLHLPETDLYSFLKEKFDQHGDNVALQDGITNDALTFKECSSHASKIASFFEGRGYSKGQSVGIHVPNCNGYQTFLLGALAKGITFTTCNPIYTVHEVRQWLASSGAKVLLTNSKMIDTARKAADNTDTEILVSVDDCNEQDSGIINLSDIIANESEQFEKAVIDPKVDVAALLYSSGTTGLPKGVMLTHHNLTTNVLQNLDALYPVKNCICVLPMFHVYGVLMHFVHYYLGAAVISLPSFDPVKFLSLIEKHSIERVPIVPPILLFLNNHPMVDEYDITSMKSLTVGAAPADEHVVSKFNAKFPHATMIQGYGLTEGLVTHMQHPTDRSQHKPGSAGYGYRHVDLKVRCLDTGEALGPNQQGEICLRGPQTMKGYYNNDEATVNCLDADGWLSTGDLGYYDEDCSIYCIDRLKELIKYKAFQVAPAELEDTLLNHPEIVDSCVIGIPDDLAGQVPRAYIVRSEGSNLTEGDVNIFMEEYLSPHKQLRGGIVFVDMLPKSASGKLLRRVLLQEYLDSQ